MMELRFCLYESWQIYSSIKLQKTSKSVSTAMNAHSYKNKHTSGLFLNYTLLENTCIIVNEVSPNALAHQHHIVL
jgi:hypothetical protein